MPVVRMLTSDIIEEKNRENLTSRVEADYVIPTIEDFRQYFTKRKDKANTASARTTRIHNEGAFVEIGVVAERGRVSSQCYVQGTNGWFKMVQRYLRVLDSMFLSREWCILT